MTAAAPAVALPRPPDPRQAPLPGWEPFGDGHRRLADVEYRVVPGFRPLLLDVHHPGGEGPGAEGARPLVLLLHGGGWAVGSRRRFCVTVAGVVERLLAEGFAVAAADYRLSAEAPFPAQLHDVRAAVRWLRHRSAELGLDPARTAVWGESAGAHLAALLGLRAGVAELPGEGPVPEEPTRVRGVVDWFGPADLEVPVRTGQPPGPPTREDALLGVAAAEHPARAREASPVAHVGPGAPPFLLAHGEADTFVPARHSVELHRRLREAGADATLHLVPAANHLWLGEGVDTAGLLDEAVGFLRRVTG